jgi:hypothetical protein
MQFKHSAMTFICYTNLCLEYYHRVIKMGLRALEEKKLSKQNKINILHYILEAGMKLDKEKKYL